MQLKFFDVFYGFYAQILCIFQFLKVRNIICSVLEPFINNLLELSWSCHSQRNEALFCCPFVIIRLITIGSEGLLISFIYSQVAAVLYREGILKKIIKIKTTT